jgi:hypothetical protein
MSWLSGLLIDYSLHVFKDTVLLINRNSVSIKYFK